MAIIAGGIVVTAILILIFFYFGVVHNLYHALLALLIVMIIAFLFTTVAANAIAIVGTNPVSGMTLMTLIITSLIMSSAGLSGQSGMVAALIIGGVVCTAYQWPADLLLTLNWLLAWFFALQTGELEVLGALVSAATVGGVIILLNKTYGFTGGEGALVAPRKPMLWLPLLNL